MQINDQTECLISRANGRFCVVDIVNPATGVGLYGKRGEGELYEGAPLERMLLDDAAEEEQRQHISGPDLTTEEAYHEMMECVPPARWGQNGFAVGEAMSGLIHSHYIHLHNRYWVMHQPITRPWPELVQMVNEKARELGLIGA